jgi:hypothetical protein
MPARIIALDQNALQPHQPPHHGRQAARKFAPDVIQ